jgi:nitrite reductase/ring-hydroxylating ferredoxin subunit
VSDNGVDRSIDPPPSRLQVTASPLTKTQRLCALTDVTNGGAHEAVATIDGASESLIVLRRDETVRVFFNVCPHAGRRLDWAPGRFLIDQGFLICAAHGACFSMADGMCISGPCRGQGLSEVGVEVREGEVFV